MTQIVITALYKFVKIQQPEIIQSKLLEFLESNDIRGTIVLAKEGINGTVSGSRSAIDRFYQWLAEHPLFAGITGKESLADSVPFLRTKVKLKKEIVTMGIEDIDPQQIVGTYVDPLQWNQLIEQPDVLLLDTRNDYEVDIGTFKGAINPDIESFREIPEYLNDNFDRSVHKKVAMFCTGGIRCEKSTAYLKQLGYDEVYHLKGGILEYLAQVPEDESLWQGDCFVFDQRVAVGHQLKVSDFQMCFACRKPLSVDDRKNVKYIKGIQCHHCADQLSSKQRQRFNERQKQVNISQTRGESHIGSDVNTTIRVRRTKKHILRTRQQQSSQEVKP